MTTTDPTREGSLTTLIDQQLELAAARLPALRPADVHPSPEEPPPEMLEEIVALETAPPLPDEELDQQALGGQAAANAPDSPAPQNGAAR